MPVPSDTDEGVPVLSEPLLATLVTCLGAGWVETCLRRGLAEAERARRDLEAARADPGEVERITHRLKGSAISVGLARIAAAAGRVEDLARARRPATPAALARLDAAIDVTRDQLARRRRGDDHPVSGA